MGMGLVRGCRGSRASEKGAVGVGLVRGCRGSREDAGHPLIALRVFHVGAPVMQRALFSDTWALLAPRPAPAPAQPSVSSEAAWSQALPVEPARVLDLTGHHTWASKTWV